MQNWQYELIISIGIILAAVILRGLLVRFFVPYFQETRSRYAWKKGINYLSWAVVLLSLTSIWIDEFHSAATFLGLVSAGLAIALKDPIVNFFGWIYIIIDRPFEMGDRIHINENQGDVLDINFFEFTLMEIGEWVQADQSTGRLVHVPNGKVFSQSIINYTQGFPFIWDEIFVTITFESNWEKAKNILLNVENEKVAKLVKVAQRSIAKGERKYNIRYTKLTPTVYTSVQPHGVRLTLRFLCNPRTRRGIEEALWESILREFQVAPDIHFAYPTQRVVWNPPGASSPEQTGQDPA